MIPILIANPFSNAVNPGVIVTSGNQAYLTPTDSSYSQIAFPNIPISGTQYLSLVIYDTDNTNSSGPSFAGWEFAVNMGAWTSPTFIWQPHGFSLSPLAQLGGMTGVFPFTPDADFLALAGTTPQTALGTAPIEILGGPSGPYTAIGAYIYLTIGVNDSPVLLCEPYYTAWNSVSGSTPNGAYTGIDPLPGYVKMASSSAMTFIDVGGIIPPAADLYIDGFSYGGGTASIFTYPSGIETSMGTLPDGGFEIILPSFPLADWNVNLYNPTDGLLLSWINSSGSAYWEMARAWLKLSSPPAGGGIGFFPVGGSGPSVSALHESALERKSIYPFNIRKHRIL